MIFIQDRIFKGTCGIYQITNKINGRKYIGLTTTSFGSRFRQHINSLNKNSHTNYNLQKDYNIYGITSFVFEAIETVDDLKDIKKLEQKYINQLDFGVDYNLNNSLSLKNGDRKIKKFIRYFNEKWMIPQNIDLSNYKETLTYKRYKNQDKKEIVDMAIKYRLIDDYGCRITFNRIINFLQNEYGYLIETGRVTVKKQKYTYKLILSKEQFEIAN